MQPSHVRRILQSAVLSVIHPLERPYARSRAARTRSPQADMHSLEQRVLFSGTGKYEIIFQSVSGSGPYTVSISKGKTTTTNASGTVTLAAGGQYVPAAGGKPNEYILSESANNAVSAFQAAISEVSYTVGGTSSSKYTYVLASATGRNYPGTTSTEPPLSQLTDSSNVTIGDGPVLAFEDGTDNDYNDWYVKAQLNSPKPCNCGNTSDHPISYDDGTVISSQTDLSSAGFGSSWSITRSWTNSPGVVLNGSAVGNGMLLSQTPTLVQDGSSIRISRQGSGASWFDSTGSGTYAPDFDQTDSLTLNSGGTEFAWTDNSGNITRFYGFDASVPAALQGQFKSYTGRGGQTATATYNGSNHLASLAFADSLSGASESYSYTYVSSGVNAGRIGSISLQRSTDSGPFRTVTYSYYDGSTSFGNAGDLQTATVADGTGNTLSVNYYRYYTASAVASLGYGYVGGLQYVFNNADYQRLAAAVGNPLTATNAQAAPYASNFYEYDSRQRVTLEAAQSGSGGLASYSYSYAASGNNNGYNAWATRNVETLPDGTTNTVYSNAFGQQMLKVYTSAAGQQWGWFTAYDASGNAILSAQPSAVNLPVSLSTLEQYPDLMRQTGTSGAGYPVYQYLNAAGGLIDLTDYYATTAATATTAGGVAEYPQDTKIENGDTATPILQSSTDYFAFSAGGATVYPTADSTQYRNTDGTGAQTTSYSYSYYPGTVQMQSMTTTLPVVTTAENGPGTADVSTDVYDQDGRVIWHQDAGGFITYNAYDPSTGALVKTIADVDTFNTGDYDTSTLPAGWSTPTGGGLNLVTTSVVDSLGRKTKTTSPDGNVTYTTYDDANQAVRVYPGWHQDPVSGLWTTTGPVQVTRDDTSGAYSESLTYAYTPASGVTVPDGSDSIANVQTLSRTLANSAGQTIESDAYFNLSSVTYSTTSEQLGSVNVNYYATTYGYDADGNRNRVQSPTGTITRTVYDGQTRAISTWVGTNDTPTSGTWSPTNNTGTSNMVEVSANFYDDTGVGDGNLTEAIQFPGAGSAPRTTQTLYDWRDRQISQKQGIATIDPLSDADIGTPALAGSKTFDGITWTVAGGGADIWGTADQFNFASQSFSGSGTVVAKVGSVSNVNAVSKAGVMFRNNSTAGSASAAVVVTPSSTVQFLWRSSAGGTTQNTTVTGITAPVWVKLQRVGDSVSGYYSTNGSTWTQVGTPQVVSLASTTLAGLAVSAHDNTKRATATFTNYAVTAAVSPSGWTDADIASPTYIGGANFDGTTLTMAGGGADIWGTSDQFNFASQSLGGDGSIVAHVTSLTNTNTSAKAGVMFRASTAANSVFAHAFVTPGGAIYYQWRSSTGGSTSQWHPQRHVELGQAHPQPATTSPPTAATTGPPGRRSAPLRRSRRWARRRWRAWPSPRTTTRNWQSRPSRTSRSTARRSRRRLRRISRIH